MLRVTAKAFVVTAAVVLLALLTAPDLHVGGQRFSCTVYKTLAQDQTPSLTSADLSGIPLATMVWAVFVFFVAQPVGAHPQPRYISRDHSASLFVRPPPSFLL